MTDLYTVRYKHPVHHRLLRYEVAYECEYSTEDKSGVWSIVTPPDFDSIMDPRVWDPFGSTENQD